MTRVEIGNKSEFAEVCLQVAPPLDVKIRWLLCLVSVYNRPCIVDVGFDLVSSPLECQM